MSEQKLYSVNRKLIEKASQVLKNRTNIFWILGGSCSGKTTLCEYLQSNRNFQIYDMDKYIFESYAGLYSKELHPVSFEWLTNPDGLDWVLSLSWEEFNSLNQATNAEFLDLFAADSSVRDSSAPLIVDGGLSHPALLKEVLPPENIVYLTRDEVTRKGLWEQEDKRLQMKEMILALPAGSDKWKKFLLFDELITAEMDLQVSTNDIKTIDIDDCKTIEKTADIAVNYFKLS